MTILFAYDGSESSAAAFAAASKIFGDSRPDAVVLTVWEPLSVEAIRAARFGGWWIPLALDVTEADATSEVQAEQLATHGVRLAVEAGFAARALWRADTRDIGEAIVEEADALNAALIVIGGHGLTGIRASLGGVSSHILRHATRSVLVAPRQIVDATHEHEGDVASVV
jgi:nucleotide-binding universal stress UspA family protein